MRSFTFALLTAATVSLAPTALFAQDRGAFVQGFGGLLVGTASLNDAAFGAVVGGRLTPNLEVVGEAGRMSNVMPPTTSLLLSVAPLGFHLSAWYGEGGLRFTSTRSSAVRPYAETTAGVARLQSNLGSAPLTNLIAGSGLRFLDRTEPIATVGGGVAFQSGAFVADLGYRYRRIFASDWIEALALGGTLHTNEVRVGIGFRF